MTRRDVLDGCLIASAIVTFMVIVAWLMRDVQLALACGDKGGDIFWGPLLRHVCIAWDGQVIK